MINDLHYMALPLISDLKTKVFSVLVESPLFLHILAGNRKGKQSPS